MYRLYNNASIYLNESKKMKTYNTTLSSNQSLDGAQFKAGKSNANILSVMIAKVKRLVSFQDQPKQQLVKDAIDICTFGSTGKEDRLSSKTSLTETDKSTASEKLQAISKEFTPEDVEHLSNLCNNQAKPSLFLIPKNYTDDAKEILAILPKIQPAAPSPICGKNTQDYIKDFGNNLKAKENIIITSEREKVASSPMSGEETRKYITAFGKSITPKSMASKSKAQLAAAKPNVTVKAQVTKSATQLKATGPTNSKIGNGIKEIRAEDFPKIPDRLPIISETRKMLKKHENYDLTLDRNIYKDYLPVLSNTRASLDKTIESLFNEYKRKVAKFSSPPSEKERKLEKALTINLTQRIKNATGKYQAQREKIINRARACAKPSEVHASTKSSKVRASTRPGFIAKILSFLRLG